jgi:tripartite-type tricarboxylate transporter receptor subunit TctC
MPLVRRQFLRLATGATALPIIPKNAKAQVYPSRPITVVVPYAPGGPTDTIARIIGEGMRKQIGQPVIIENVSGADGRIGVGRVARATPDGYTLSVGNLSTHVFNGAIYALQYDLANDFAPVSLLAESPQIVTTRRTVAVSDMKGLLIWLKENSGKISVGISGVGSPPHVAGVFFQNAIGARFQFVPYRGGTLAMQDLVASQIDMIMASSSDALPQMRAKSVKGYAVMAKTRLSTAPDLPTVDEVGLPQLYFSAWFAMFAPKGTPRTVVSQLNAAIVFALAEAVARQRLSDLGQEIFPRDRQTPEALGAFHKAEIEKWWPIIKAANIKGE